ncbi:hypothetical protein JAAARDRAFT_176968 [Jaapia argillacea MUCL 33604]|uniref:Ornithine cyclodeaminase n=1 Tax=Jaapia argillacea MUCL 33604 TaxID=933084 RepID=A0A067Q304_9AGAM|nr:hypothetical protein JAAARDRAFT_176968 [Jaapia argillacea MUCL 33604]
MSLLILTASDVARITSTLTPQDLLDQASQVFSRFSSTNNKDNDIVAPHRTTIRMAKYSALFMPSRIVSHGTAIKVVSVPNFERGGGLPASTMVMDETTGGVKALVNARVLTALRTAAGSLLSSTLLIPPSSPPTHLVAFGAGNQISAHVTLHLKHFPSITNVTIVNRTSNDRLSTLNSTLAEQFPNVAVSTTPLVWESIQKRVAEASIIITATTSTIPLFHGEWVKPGTHIILIGSYTPAMHEIDSILVRRAGKVVVDSRDACLREAGELILAGIKGDGMVELGELDIAEKEGDKELVEKVKKGGDVTIFKSVGVGVQDVAIASAVVKRAEELGLGTKIDDYDE